ncbi:MAG TPA: Lar family restriction alleviation protein [Candidatus Mediterraneibacter excrementigallinarum]|nr:Lar family restriction alleviation protein [Candidatus Mediterraneibacter excrementigallinarum]
MSEIKLKPCPFCGGEAKLTGNPYAEMWVVECGICHALSDVCHTQEDAAEKWNRRESDD